MRKTIILTILALCLFCVQGCTSASANKSNTDMYIEFVSDMTADKTLSYDFVVDSDVRTVRFFLYRLNGNTWEQKLGTAWAYTNATGSFSLDDGDVMNGVRFILKGAEDHDIDGFYEIQEPLELSSDDFSHSTSLLGERTAVEYEKEIPFMLQIITTKDRILSKGIEFFDQPEVLNEEGYEEVYAATVLFSRNEPNAWDNIESVKIYSDGYFGRSMEDPLVISDEDTIRKLIQYISDESQIKQVPDEEKYEGINSIFVDLGNGVVVSMYNDMNYGNIGSEMTEHGEDVWLPKKFHDLVISLLKQNQ